MTPYDRYRTRAATGWTRIDMLLALYDAALRAVDEALAGMTTQGQATPQVRLKAQQFVLLLLEGIDASAGEPAPSIRRLLLFVLDRLQAEGVAAWRDARKVLGLVREAFQQVADEACRLEQQGVIPPLDLSTTVACSASA